jgi:hypothetical protein
MTRPEISEFNEVSKKLLAGSREISSTEQEGKTPGRHELPISRPDRIQHGMLNGTAERHWAEA